MQHFWDITAVSALRQSGNQFRREGAEVEVDRKNEASAKLFDKFGFITTRRSREKVNGPTWS